MVETTLSYLAPMPERPVYYLHRPPPDAPWRNTRGDRRRVFVQDARGLDPEPCLDREGFALARHRTAVSDLWDGDAVVERFYPEVEGLVQRVTGAARVVAFDHNLRSASAAEAQDPVRYVHNDYTEASAPQRVRDLMGDEAEKLLRQRVAVINVWKPIRGPVQATPLAVCDARSLRMGDFVPTGLEYRDRSGEVYSVTWNDSHRWFYFPSMQADEALLLKCYDSDPHCARFTAHTAFDDPTTPEGAAARESIEVRTLAFFAPPA